MNFHSLKFKIPAFFAIYLTVMILLSIFLVLGYVQENALEEKNAKNLLISELMSKKIDVYIHAAMADVETSAKYISENEKTEEIINYEINRVFDNYKYFDLVFFMNLDGKLVFSKPYNEDAVKNNIYTDRDYFNHIVKYKKPYVSKLYMSRILNEPHFVIAVPVFENNELYGLMAAGSPLKEMKRIIMDTEVAFNGGIWVTDMFGALIVNPYEELSDKKIATFKNNSVIINNEKTDIYSLLERKAEGNIILNRDGKNYYVAMTFVDDANLAVLVEQEEEVIIKEALEIFNDLKLITIIIVVVGIFLGLVLSIGITSPIEKLVLLVRMWSSGENKFIGISEQKRSEIGELSEAFKEMADNLDKKVEELKNSVFRENQIQQYLNNILMSAGSGIIVVDEDRKIVIFNRAAEILSGYSRDTIAGYEYSYFSNKVNLDLDGMIRELNESKGDTIEKEIIVLNREKHAIPCRVIGSSIRGSHEDQRGYVFLINNLEVIKNMEEELLREDRLSIMGEFSSSIIHDIGNPLAGLSNLLELYQSDLIDEKEKKEILELIEDEIKELNNIVLNFLSFTKSNETENVQVNICQIVNEAVNILRAEMINRDIKISMNFEKEEMYAKVDRRNFKQALINIIKNSIQAIEGSGMIAINIYWLNSDTIIKIKDTGIGMKEDEMKNIFEPFYTTKKDGTGLGLSTAYKTIRDNDGKLEVKSQYRKGAEFTITIPGKGGYDEYTNH